MEMGRENKQVMQKQPLTTSHKQTDAPHYIGKQNPHIAYIWGVGGDVIAEHYVLWDGESLWPIRSVVLAASPASRESPYSGLSNYYCSATVKMLVGYQYYLSHNFTTQHHMGYYEES